MISLMKIPESRDFFMNQENKKHLKDPLKESASSSSSSDYIRVPNPMTQFPFAATQAAVHSQMTGRPTQIPGQNLNNEKQFYSSVRPHPVMHFYPYPHPGHGYAPAGRGMSGAACIGEGMPPRHYPSAFPYESMGGPSPGAFYHGGNHEYVTCLPPTPMQYAAPVYVEQDFVAAGRKRQRHEMATQIMPSTEYVAYQPQYPPHAHQYIFHSIPTPNSATLPGNPPVKKKKETKSPYRGVFWNNQSKVWIASITAGGRKKHLGCFDEEKEAALAYDREAIKLKGSLATVNFSSSAARFKAEETSGIIIESTRHIRKRAEKTSKYRGVCWNKYNQCWKACIKVNGKNKHLGYFSSEVDAAKAYDAFSLEHRRKKAKLNFPEETEKLEIEKEDEKLTEKAKLKAEAKELKKTFQEPKAVPTKVIESPKMEKKHVPQPDEPKSIIETSPKEALKAVA
mmetsp:Transcript_8102/g.10571  ORF Transcript_8102/g.10571 Transcript_8102/m.10571 type:complete len:453 (-) Transcript_8102:79-1437(-)